MGMGIVLLYILMVVGVTQLNVLVKTSRKMVNLMVSKLYYNKLDLEGRGSELHNSAETMSNCFTSKSQQTIQ